MKKQDVFFKYKFIFTKYKYYFVNREKNCFMVANRLVASDKLCCKVWDDWEDWDWSNGCIWVNCCESGFNFFQVFIEIFDKKYHKNRPFRTILNSTWLSIHSHLKSFCKFCFSFSGSSSESEIMYLHWNSWIIILWFEKKI